MCRKCDNLRREIAASRELSTGLTAPGSVLLMKDDLKALEERMNRMVAELHPAAKQA
ncbi:hypothetical protein GGQ85_003371 [Nitrobacter vulgaris]|jgi:hypothetical protein|uniref:hypothetical protein n=1 Tax=Nitrobacter vulgaris TaxID=29421 RepID=UPI00285567C2|nr:hypothetical protein [Nitrobacter vulgaris]MDR6305647.1 hypothetical protein [Nitrobacter vulgaris]